MVSLSVRNYMNKTKTPSQNQTKFLISSANITQYDFVTWSFSESSVRKEVIDSSHARSWIPAVIVWGHQLRYKLFLLAGLIYPIAERHTFVLSLLSCCCPFLNMSPLFMLLLYAPTHLPVFWPSPVSSCHLPHQSQQNHQPPPPSTYRGKLSCNSSGQS